MEWLQVALVVIGCFFAGVYVLHAEGEENENDN